MSYKIVVDSACDRIPSLVGLDNLEFVPLTLLINDTEIIDDESFVAEDFIKKIRENGGIGKTACPAPDAFKSAYEGDYDEVYVVTITDKLSGCYNSALQGKMLYEEEHNDGKKIHVFNSLATSGSEILIAQKIKELADSGMSFDELVDKVENYIINEATLYFVLESLDALKQNGRLFALAAKVVEKIKIKLVCAAKEGNISPMGQDLTSKRALIKLVKIMAEATADSDHSDKKVIITHVCNEEMAKTVSDMIKEKTSFKDVSIYQTSGLNTFYATNGSILVAFEK